MIVQLDSVIRQVEQLPPLPSTSLKIMQLSTDPKATIDDVLEVVRYDQTLTGQVLRLCNSAYFGLSRRIASLREALAYLGSMPLLQLIMGVHCSTMLRSAQPGYGLPAGMLWQHSTGVAIAAGRLGEHVNADKPEAIFTAGLLHDIGKVVLGRFLADRYQEILDLLAEKALAFHEAEKELLGYTHAEVGELICRRWQLPEQITASARYHHMPATYAGNGQDLRLGIELVHLADALVLSMGIGGGVDGLQYEINPHLAEKYNLDETTLEKMSLDVLGQVERLEHVYSKP